MDGLAHITGVGPRVTLNGKSYQVRGKTNRFYAEVEAEILRLRGDPFQMLIDAAIRGKATNDETLLSRIAESVAGNFRNWRVMTYSDYWDFLNSPMGDAFLVFHCLHKDDPELKFEDVHHYLAQIRLRGGKEKEQELKSLFAAIHSASGDDILGNSNGRISEEEKVPDPAQTGE